MRTVKRLVSFLTRQTAVPVQVPDVGSFQFVLHRRPDIWISDTIRRGGIFEPYILRAIKAILPHGGTFIDVGANIGWFTVIASRLVGPSGRVVAVEPDPDNLAILRANVRRNDCRNVSVIRGAAGALARKALLYRSPDNQGDHRLETISDRQDWVRVKVRTLDDIVVRHVPGDTVRVVKMDTQGSESAVLRGMSAIMRSAAPVRLILEFWPYGLGRCGSSAQELAALLGQHDLHLWLLRGDGSVSPVTLSDLVRLAMSEFAPDGQHYADLVAITKNDDAAVSAMRASVVT
jgi:FkbM family methyltransferase